MANSFTILCLPYSPRTVLATASIFAKLVLYQLLLKCTKCQYGELTVSLIFSADENTRHAHCASVSHKATPSGITVSGHRSHIFSVKLNFAIISLRSQFLRPFSRIINENLLITHVFCACSLGYCLLSGRN